MTGEQEERRKSKALLLVTLTSSHVMGHITPGMTQEWGNAAWSPTNLWLVD